MADRRRTGFTTRASCLLAAGITAVLCGLLLGELDLVRAGVLAAAIPCVAALIVRRAQVQIANRRSVEPVRASAGEAVTVNLVISNRSVLRTGTLLIEDQLPERLVGRARFVLDPLGSHETRTVSYRMPGLGRGRYRVGPLRIRLNDPFRLIDVTRSFTATSEFVVGPVIDQLAPVEPPRSDEMGDSAGSHSVGTHGADDQSTREYRTGDDLRKIHWRSSARTGALMVRQEERPWRGQSTVLLDLRASAHTSARDSGMPSPADPRLGSSFEWAVSAAASIGSHLLLRGRELGLLGDPGDDRLRVPDSTSLANHLAGIRTVNHSDLTVLGGPIRSAVRESSLVAVLGRLDPTSLRVLADAHPRGRSSPAFAILLDVDTWRDPLLDETTKAVAAAAQVLRNAGWRVVVARQGEATALAWELMLSGIASSARGAAVIR
ncbi:MAG: hypothetical protein QOH89_1828 [Pseudonocardiales bacterium]|nr:hypothetical protein [Pseudonocardiales bacterium]MDT4940540.1 hypothetical protein [Pseudonocardiales bacterium]